MSFGDRSRHGRQEVPELRPSAGRVPPHDLDAEAAVLSAALLSTQEYIDQAEQAVFDIARIPENTAVRPVREAIHGAFDILVAASKRGEGITGVPTGFDRLDRKCAGLHKGDLYIVAGRPGMGKTAFVLNIAVNVASPRRVRGGDAADALGTAEIEEPGWGVGFFSLEMPREKNPTP